ncbi:MAG: hypothetical protein ISR72_01990 [Methylobacter sp.]|nr:hypothetical protein [Methylobacter sp.]
MNNKEKNEDYIYFTPEQLALITGGVWENLSSDLKINEFNYILDYVKNDDLFVVRHDEWPDHYKSNSHKIKEAISRGSTSLMVDYKCVVTINIPILRVKNTYLALQEIALRSSETAKIKRVLIVGSYGKTACKNHLAQLIKRFFNTYYRKDSANYPASTYCNLASIKKSHELLIIEQPVSNRMIERAKYILPDICIVTSIGHEHIEKFGTIKNIIKLKSSVAGALSENGIFIIPKDSIYYDDIQQELLIIPQNNILTFGSTNDCNAYILHQIFIEFGWSILAVVENIVVNYYLPFPEIHAPNQSLAVLLCAYHLGVDLQLFVDDYYQCHNFYSSGKLYDAYYEGKQFYLYDQSHRGGIEGYESFFKTLSYFKPKGTGKKIVVTSEFVDCKDNEVRFINFEKFKVLIKDANIDEFYTVENFCVHINILPEKYKWKNHQFDFNDIKKEIIDSISNNDILCIKGIFESKLSNFVTYIKKIDGLIFKEHYFPPKNHDYYLALSGIRILKETGFTHIDPIISLLQNNGNCESVYNISPSFSDKFNSSETQLFLHILKKINQEYVYSSEENILCSEYFDPNSGTLNLNYLDCESLTNDDLKKFHILKQLEGSIFLKSSVITDFIGLENLERITGDLNISGDSIIDIHGFNNLTEVSKLIIHEMPNLKSISGFNALQKINNSL